MLPYYFISFAIEPFVETEQIVDKSPKLPGPPKQPKPENNGEYNMNRPPLDKRLERMGIPSMPLLAKDIFFKNRYHILFSFLIHLKLLRFFLFLEAI
ncbi:MAG: hypothetical protein DRO92_00610 [Candidatus Altiarchaeales archaeon]|nr:MAG: hypothetical protein DRO92_00610 [Candidatus Altiarchaeales archaeon]